MSFEMCHDSRYDVQYTEFLHTPMAPAFPHTLFIGPNLDPLVFSVRGGEALLAVGRGVWV